MKRLNLTVDVILVNALFWLAFTRIVMHYFPTERLFDGLFWMFVPVPILLGILFALTEPLTRRHHGFSEASAHFASALLVTVPMLILAEVLCCMLHPHDGDGLWQPFFLSVVAVGYCSVICTVFSFAACFCICSDGCVHSGRMLLIDYENWNAVGVFRRRLFCLNTDMTRRQL